MMDFKKVDYLKTGNNRQRHAYSILQAYRIIACLQEFNPILTGTIPIGIDLPDSDLDIICACDNHAAFETYLKRNFSHYSDFRIKTNLHSGVQSTIANFIVDNQRIEIFGQNIPTDKQYAYRHMLVEYQILQDRGCVFKNKVVELKKQGMKTEPAFAHMLGLVGDPYVELLRLDMHLTIRAIKPDEYNFLSEMLYQAIFVPDEREILPRTIIEQPDLKRYIHNFGQDGDFCLVAEQNEKLLGAIWIRYIVGYGFVDNQTPELSMAILKEYRGKGIGTLLLDAMIHQLKNGSVKQISLSVDKDNFAYHLYKYFGFEDYKVTEKSVIMLKHFSKHNLEL
jgi:GNAT superfamily N-acetyltransferase